MSHGAAHNKDQEMLTVPASNNNAPDVASPMGGSPAKGKKSLEVEHNFDDSLDYFGLDKKRMFEMVERRSVEILRSDFEGTAGVANRVQSDLNAGIANTPAEEKRRQDSFGVNILSKKEPVTFWEFFVEACSDKIVIILAVAAVVSIILGMTVPNPHTGLVELSHGWIEGTAIIISIAVVALTGSINNYQKALQFEEMEKDQSIKKLDVKRGGEKISIMSDHLVVGDLLYLEYGMELSVDGLIMQANDLKMNESSITGEPDMIEKDPHEDPFILSGTSVEEGSGLALVIGVGMQSFQGHLKQSLDEESKDTPLQEHLSELADRIGIVGFIAAAVLLIALCIKEGILIAEFGKAANGSNFLGFVLIAITLIVVAIPEGLPLAVTIALAFAMKAMMKDNCMVRVLASCETMGAATAVCSDKTGTLTTNEMTCVQGCIGGEEFMSAGRGIIKRHEGVHIPDDKNFQLRTHPDVLNLFCTSVALNSTADRELKDGKERWRGNKTEVGMLQLLEQLKFDFKGVRSAFPFTSDHHHIKQFPFNSAKKRMATIIREKNETFTLHVKGASETILADCDYFLGSQGQTCVITPDVREIFNDVIVDMASQGNRTIGVACLQELDMPADGNFPRDEPEVRLVFLGVMGIMDPIRTEVPLAIDACTTAGVRVRMCTGDNIMTAISIARKCHLYDDREEEWDLAMLGQDFHRMNENDRPMLEKLVPRLAVMARCSPHDKYILVQMLQGQGEVVGVTGDGTNDAPALKLADVGFAMNSGTDIAKGASDMVLLDDNFATVVTGIKWGRAVNDNIKKFLQFQLTINFSGVFLTLIASLISDNSKEPFSPVQLLWLNLIMDTLAALSLATELPEEASLERKPVYKDGPLISNRMWCFIGVHGTWQVIVIIVVLLVGHNWFNFVEDPSNCDKYIAPAASFDNGTVIQAAARIACNKLCTDDGGTLSGYRCKQGPIHSTFLFNIFIWMQVCNVVNARKIHGELNPLEGAWTRSKQLIIIFALIGGLQAIAVQLFGRFMSTAPLSGPQWGISLGIAALELIIGILQRFIPLETQIPDNVKEKYALHKEQRAQVKKETDAKRAAAGGSSVSEPAGQQQQQQPESHHSQTAVPNAETGAQIASAHNIRYGARPSAHAQ